MSKQNRPKMIFQGILQTGCDHFWPCVNSLDDENIAFEKIALPLIFVPSQICQPSGSSTEFVLSVSG